MSVRCIYIVPSQYAQAIEIDEAKDMLIVSDKPQWQNYLPLRANFVHYIGNDSDVFEFARKVKALSVRWQPLTALDVKVSGLNRVILHLALLAPLTLRCDDASFSEIHLTHGGELFEPIFPEHTLPLIVIKADKNDGRIPNLPRLHHITELEIDIPWHGNEPVAFDCLQLLPFLSLQTLILKGPLSMPKSLTLLPLSELELHNVPDFKDFPLLSAFPKLEELTLCSCETIGSQNLQQQAKKLPDLTLYYMSTVDQVQWQERGYVYDLPPQVQIQNHSVQDVVPEPEPSTYHYLGDSVISIELDELQEAEEQLTAQQAQALEAQKISDQTKSLFERMRTESVTEFFRGGKKEAATQALNNEPTLLQRLRTESVTELFRPSKADTDAQEVGMTEPFANDEQTVMNAAAKQEMETQKSLFQRMKTESVSEFFRNQKTAEAMAEDETDMDVNDTDHQTNTEEQSLLTRMRTESVTEFFRNNKRNK